VEPLGSVDVNNTTSVPALVDRVLGWYLDRNPVHAALLGSLNHDHALGDFSAAALTAQEREAEEWLARLTETDATGPDVQVAIDRDLLVAVLRGMRAKAGWPVWRRDPAHYVAPVLSGLFAAFLHRLRPEPELVRSVEARLAEVPAALAACQANLDPDLASPLLVRRALGQVRTGRGFLTHALPAEVGDETLRARVAEAAEPAAVAFDELAKFLEGFAERARGEWRMGEKLYSTLLTEQEMLDYGADHLHERGRAAYAELDTQMRELAARVPGGSADWRAVMARLQDDHPPTLEAMRAEYAAETERARAFLAEHGLVTFADGEECRVVPSPTFQRPLLAVAFYMSPPPLTPSRVGHFFTPFTPDDFTEEQVTQRLRTNARAQMPTIAVHEAYPGHHWHLSWLAGNPRRVRKGWALYAERLLREHGYFAEPAHELAHLEARIFRAARIVVDTALHCGDMTVEQAEEFMAARTSLTPGTAAGEVNRYCAWPTQAPSYLTGALEIERIRDDYLAAGRGDLRTFHDTLAGSGALPLGLARRVAMEG